MTWTSALIDELRIAYPKEGARPFAIRHGLTRNAVIGKAQRLGLSSPSGLRGGRRPNALRPARDPSDRPMRADRPKRAKAPLVIQRGPEQVSTFHHCKWPVEGTGLGVRYCGEPVRVRDGRCAPYCPDHCEKAFLRKGAA